mmetsp:Transcript_48953/g.149025  ORF Transcript_48953/g.149025 Transcript_48953/m.149025 type:complete len:80 (+) Transcript_48953:510-749(+)
MLGVDLAAILSELFLELLEYAAFLAILFLKILAAILPFLAKYHGLEQSFPLIGELSLPLLRGTQREVKLRWRRTGSMHA